MFDDVQGHWAQKTIAGAQHYGLIHGYRDRIFAPDEPITREQMALILAKAYDLRVQSAVDFAAIESGALLYEDADHISAWAREAVRLVTEQQVMIGLPGNKFQPQALATRAEAAVVLLKLIRE